MLIFELAEWIFFVKNEVEKKWSGVLTFLNVVFNFYTVLNSIFSPLI